MRKFSLLLTGVTLTSLSAVAGVLMPRCDVSTPSGVDTPLNSDDCHQDRKLFAALEDDVEGQGERRPTSTVSFRFEEVGPDIHISSSRREWTSASPSGHTIRVVGTGEAQDLMLGMTYYVIRSAEPANNRAPSRDASAPGVPYVTFSGTTGLGRESIAALEQEGANSPEPATWMLLMTGLAGLGWRRLRRN